MRNYESIDIVMVENNSHDAEFPFPAFKKNNLGNSLFVVEDAVNGYDFFCNKNRDQKICALDLTRVIFLNLKLQKNDGIEALKIIKSDPELEHITLAIVPSLKKDPEIREVNILGSNSSVLKPSGFKSFLESIQYVGFSTSL